MKLLIAFALVNYALGGSQSYRAPPVGGPGLGKGGFSGGFDDSGESFNGGGGQGGGKGGFGGGGQGGGKGGYGGGCGPNEILHFDGSCVIPEVSRNIYVYKAPEIKGAFGPPPQIPKPKVTYNVVFVRTPDFAEGLEPIVIPPPQQKTLVYVLTKNGQLGGQQIIEVPAGPNESPEVFYVNYNDGDNPSLPGGLTLQDALESAIAQEGQIVGGDDGFGGGHGDGLNSGAGFAGGSSGGAGFHGGSFDEGGFGGGVSGGHSGAAQGGFNGGFGGALSGGGLGGHSGAAKGGFSGSFGGALSGGAGGAGGGGYAGGHSGGAAGGLSGGISKGGQSGGFKGAGGFSGGFKGGDLNGGFGGKIGGGFSKGGGQASSY